MPFPMQLTYLNLGGNDHVGISPQSWSNFTSVSTSIRVLALLVTLLGNPAVVFVEHVEAIVLH